MMPSGPCPAKIMIIGEAPGEHEERLGRPFVGPSGLELDRMLHDAKLLRSECFVTNVCRVRPAYNNIENFVDRRKTQPASNWTKVEGLWLSPEAYSGYLQLQKEIELCQPTVIIALGNLAMWAVTFKWGISDWRGSYLKCISRPTTWVIPSYHPAAIMRQWSWRSYAITDLTRVASLVTDGPPIKPQYNIIIRPQFDEVLRVLEKLVQILDRGPTHLSCDIETRNGHIACLGLAWSKVDALCVPFLCDERASGYWSETEEPLVIDALRRVLEHPNARISGQYFVYDCQYIWKWFKIKPRLALDTMVTHHVCWPGTDKALDVLSSLYCEWHVYWKKDGKEWRAKQDENILWLYNGEDCVRTWEIAEVLADLVVQLGFEEQCIFQHTAWWRTFNTMNRGVLIDKKARAEFSKELGDGIKQREAWLTDVLGHPLNVRSPKQMKELFYNDFKLPIQYKRTKEGPKPTLDDEAITHLSVLEPLVRPLVAKVQEIRTMGVFKSTFVDAELDPDGRIRCAYNVAGTETFRLNSSENAFGTGTNLQNIPEGGEQDTVEDIPLELPNVRVLFCADEGYEMFDMDLVSADLHIVAWESGEEELKAMLRAGISVYIELAKEFYHATITKQENRYTIFKSLCHGTNYLGTARGLAKKLGLSVAQTERTQKWYFQRFPKIAKWQDNLRDGIFATKSVRNAFGYRRYYFDRIEGTLLNQAAAWIPQSTVGLLINKIWDRVVTEEPEVDILLQVHDSLVGQYPLSRAAYFRQRLKELSLITIPYEDPLIIPTGFKTSTKSWGHCE